MGLLALGCSRQPLEASDTQICVEALRSTAMPRGRVVDVRPSSRGCRRRRLLVSMWMLTESDQPCHYWSSVSHGAMARGLFLR